MSYNRWSDNPRFYCATHLFVWCNLRSDGYKRGSCAAKESEKLCDYMKARARELGLQRVRVDAAGCLDRCELGPSLVIYPEWIWCRIESTTDTILERHLLANERVPELTMSSA